MSPIRALVALLIPLSLALSAAPHVVASNPAGSSDVVIAIIDTGVRVNHTDFVYGGDGHAPAGQFVAWWDFTAEKGPREAPAGRTWDTRWGPYDTYGHGTGTASRAAGKTSSLNAGGKLAIAKVGTTTTDATGAKSATLANLTEAYEWAVNVVHADVVSVSIGSIIPTTPAVDHILFESFDRSIHRAMENGTLTIVSGGNGIEDACGPTFSWLSSFSYSDAAIAVGSLSEDASQPLLVSCSAFQPDISSGGNAVHGACIASDTCYDETLSGTSFAAPRVAGGAATLLREAIAGGPDLGARHLRDLVLSCVVDDVWPYATEGAGFFNQPAVDRGLSHARDGTLCPYSSTFNVASNQADTQREGQLAHTMKHLQGHNMVVVDQDGFLRIPDQRVLVPVAAATTGPVVMGASTPAAFEIQRYDVRLAPGQRFTATASWAPDGTTDMDLYLVPAGKVGVGAYFPALAVQQSANGADVMESIDHTTIAGGDYTLLLVGFAVPASTTVTVTTSSGTYAGEDLAVGNLVL